MTADAVLVPLQRVGRNWLALGSMLALALGGLLGALLFATDSASAANVAIDQCNGVGGGGGQTVQCNVLVVNTLTDDPNTTGSVITVNGVVSTSPDLVTSVTQCNGSANGGNAILECHVQIINNIAVSGPAGATGVSIHQCNDNQPDGLGTAPNTCSPPPIMGGTTIVQCNDTGDGGGLVFPSHCSASGTVSSTLPVTVNQCNGSANGGGSKVNCSTDITTFVVDTGVGGTPTTTTPTTADGGGSTPGGGGSTPGGGGTTAGGGGTTAGAGAATTPGSGSSTGAGSDTGTAGGTGGAGGAPGQGSGSVVADAKLTG